MITLYWCAKTRASRVLWLLEELGEPFEIVEIDISDTASKADPEFRAASPMGKVPAIRHTTNDSDDAVCMADSAAIALYLADRYPQAGLAPAIDAPDRGSYLYWMVFTPGVIEPAMAEHFGGWEPQPGHHGWGSFDLMIETLTNALKKGPWLLGEKFSAADIIVGSSVNFLRMFGVLPDNEILSAYADRCLARPPYQRAMEREPAD